MRHSAVPETVERAVAALPYDAHFMGIVLTALNALSTCHAEQNPALAGQNVYDSKEIQDKQIVRLIGACACWPLVHRGILGLRWLFVCVIMSLHFYAQMGGVYLENGGVMIMPLRSIVQVGLPLAVCQC